MSTRKLAFLSLAFIFFALLLHGCFKSKKKSSPAPAASNSNPWGNAGRGGIPTSGPAITNTVRRLAFNDGMTISYDGQSSDPANQEVCRQEEHNGQEIRVCMDLENDPGVGGGVQGTNPLTSGGNRPQVFVEKVFADVLTCYVDGVRQFNCNTVFETISSEVGEDFNCQADLVNGDKALRCSDDWAIVVNGDEDEQEKTICRVNLADGSGRCLSAPKMEDTDDDGVPDTAIPVEELIMEMQKTTWPGYRSPVNAQYPNPAQMRAEAILSPADFADAPEEAEISFEVTTEDVNGDGTIQDDEVICRVANDGILTADDATLGTCKVVVTIEAEGFVDRVFNSQMEVVAANDATWGGYNISNNFYPGEGSALAALDAPSDGSLSSPRYGYTSLTRGICTVNPTTGALTAVSAGACRVQLDVSADGFIDMRIVETATVNGLGTFTSISWGNWGTLTDSQTVADTVDFTGGNAGDLPVADPANDVDGTSVDIEIRATSDGCYYSSGNILSFADATPCVVSVTASGRGYADSSADFTVTPTLGSQTVDQQLQYQGDLRPGGELAVYAIPTSSAGFVTITYAVTAQTDGSDPKSDVCTVDAASGTVSAGSAAAANDQCEVTATLSVSGYADVTSQATVIVAGTALAPQNAPSGWNEPYGASPTVAVGRPSSAPSGVPSGTGALDYRVQAGSTGCSVDHSSGVVTGVNTVGGCIIEALFMGDDDTLASPYSVVAEISITIGDQPDPMGADIYADANGCTDRDEVRLGATTSGPCGPLPNTMGMAGEVELHAWDDADPDSGAAATACRVNSEGAVTGLEVGGDCFIHARFAAVANRFNESDWVNISGNSGISIVNGEMAEITWEPSQENAVVGEEVTLDPVVLGSHPSAQGAQVAYSIEGSQDCTITSGRTVEFSSYNAAGTCTVTATITKDDYENKILTHDIAVTTRSGSAMLITWAGYDPGTITYGDAAPASGQVTTDPSNSDLAYASGDTSICTVANDGVLSILAGGECAITLTATQDDDSSNSATRTAVVMINKVAQAALAASDLYAADTMRVGGTLDLTGTVSAAGVGDFELRSTTEGVCSVAESGFNRGRITAIAGGICHIQMRWGGNAQTAPSNWASVTGTTGITVQASDQAAPAAWDEPYGYGPTIFAGAAISLVANQVPASRSGSGGYEYGIKSGAEHCMAMPNNGMVVGESAGRCVIQVRYRGNANYNPSPWVELATIGVLPRRALTFNSVPTLAYTGDLHVGDTSKLSPSGLPSTDGSSPPVNIVWQYMVQGLRGTAPTDGICELADPEPLHDGDGDDQTPRVVNPEHGKIQVGASAQADDICRVQAVALAIMGGAMVPSYLTYTQVAAVEKTVLAGSTFSSLTWNQWATNTQGAAPSGTVDFSSKMPTSSPAADNYEIAVASGGCSWNSGSEELTYRSDVGDCEITVTAKKSGYADKTERFRVAVANILSSIVDPIYPSTFQVGGGAITPSTSASASLVGGGNAAIAYSAQGVRGSTDTENICSATNTATGQITLGSDARANDICRVTATYSGADHHTVTRTVNVRVNAGTGTIARGNIPNSGTVGAAGIDLDNAANGPTASPSAGVTFDFTYVSGSCSLAADHTLTFVGGTTDCVIRVSANKDHYTYAPLDVTITVNAGTQSVSGTLSYPNTFRIGGTAVSASAKPTSAGATIKYAVTREDASDGTDQGAEDVCTVDEDSGDVSIGDDPTIGDQCDITVTIARDGYASVTQSATLDVLAGTQSIIGDLTYTATLRIGGNPVSPATRASAASSTSVTYAVEETDSSNVAQTDGEVCSVDGTGVVSIGSSPSSGDKCIVTVTISRTGYADLTDVATLIVAAALQAQTLTAPVYSENTNLFDGTGNRVWVVSGGTSDQTDTTISYTVQGKRGGTANTNDGTDQSGVCSSSSGSLYGSTRQIITVGADAQTNDKCVVTMTASATATHAEDSVEVILTVQAPIAFSALKTRIFDKDEAGKRYGCTFCHGATGTSGKFLETQAAMTAREGTTSGFLHASDPGSSRLFGRVNAETMPVDYDGNTKTVLSDVDKEYVAAYIRGGDRS